ncbi:MAG: phosphopyruvate hydratase [Bdellovibrio sp.]|nr:MAG: phosphopyruvate hydratase [Bdellovibrio sp.]
MAYSIQKLHARQILDSRGNPTVEVDLCLSSGAWGRAAVPSGASTGAYEACELRDQDPKVFHGKGVLKAVSHVNKDIFEALKDKTFSSQEALDNFLIELDGTENKSRLGANAILGVSIAFAKALSVENQVWVFQLFDREYRLPVPLMNILNGGAHADNNLDVQEFMIVPFGFMSYTQALRAGSEIFHQLKKILNKKGLSTAVGDEGGFAPRLSSNKEALDLIMESIEEAGYRPGKEVSIALDVAATELYHEGTYSWEGQRLSSKELSEVYSSWRQSYPIVSLEDGFSEDDWAAWSLLTQKEGKNLQLVGDDLFVTNVNRLKRGIEEKAANALLVKVNQIGTVTETIKAVELAQSAQFHTVMSHRSGETEDTFIADLSVGLGSEQIKTGSLCRGERIAKYNQLLRIEEFLGEKATFWGAEALFS